MNTDFWLRIAIAAAVIVGIWTVCGKDMLLARPADWMEDHFPRWVTKPLFVCPPCMSSVHGTWIWLVTGGHWTGIPIFCLALCGVMKLIAGNFLE